MRVLSIDVGIKNLACCVLDIDDIDASYEIVYWNVIDMCNDKQSCAKCKQNATYRCPSNVLYCTFCGKKSPFRIPPIIPKKVSKERLIDIAKSWGVSLTEKIKKNDLIKLINEHDIENTLIKLERNSASSMSLIEIGKSIRCHLDNDVFLSVDKVLIENQIGPLAIRMKTLQGMLAQFFIMKGIDNIEFVSAVKKLKNIDKKTTYKERKALGIEETRKRVNNEWRKHFENHKKKDDLADCFLQAIVL